MVCQTSMSICLDNDVIVRVMQHTPESIFAQTIPNEEFVVNPALIRARILTEFCRHNIEYMAVKYDKQAVGNLQSISHILYLQAGRRRHWSTSAQCKNKGNTYLDGMPHTNNYIIMHVHKQEQDSNTHDNIMKQKIINSTDENLQVRKHKHCYIILLLLLLSCCISS